VDDVLQLPVVLTEALGSDLLVHVSSTASPVHLGDVLDDEADLVGLEASARLVARVPPGARAELGAPVRLRVDLARLHFFDPDTQLALR
jgi:multiple sugar transport system ATP-binding protein